MFVRAHFLDLEHGRRSVFFQRRADNDVDGQRDGRAAPFGLFHDFLAADSTSIRLDTGTCRLRIRRPSEGIGDAAAHDKLVHALGKIVQDFKFGRNLGAADDGEQRMLGRIWRIRVTASSSAAMSRPTQATLARSDGPFGGSLRAWRRGERIHDTYTSPSAASLRATSSLFFFFALVEAHVLAQDAFAGLYADAVQIVLLKPDRNAEQFLKAFGHGSQRKLRRSKRLLRDGQGARAR